MITGEIVDYLNHRTEGAQRVVENDAARVIDNVPPLPVAVGFGGELREGRMPGIAKNSHRVRLLGGKPDRAPEYGEESAGQALGRAHLTCEQDDLFAVGEGQSSLGVPLFG